MHSDPDNAVRQTDFDALSSRLSCYLKGYSPEDTYILDIVPLLMYYQLLGTESEFRKFALARSLKTQFFNLFPVTHTTVKGLINLDKNAVRSKINKFTPLKSPMINRGTYLRTKAISDHIDAFMNSHSEDPLVQIVSLGAGNDTRPFNLLPRHHNLQYFELDMEQTTRLKALTILSSPTLSEPVGATALTEQQLPSNAGQVLSFPSSLNTPNYHLLPCDLRLLREGTSLSDIKELSHLEASVPTLIVSECCICYLSQTDSNNLIQFWSNNLKSDAQLLIYEPLGGPEEGANNKYGHVMIRNLICRGIEMPTLMEYGTIDRQKARFEQLIPRSTVWCRDMKWVYENQITQPEIERISQLELLDEMEELNLINSHYCLIVVKW
jgi:[phosphatase 2A protein]-leucine-carboxy methyltransferase